MSLEDRWPIFIGMWKYQSYLLPTAIQDDSKPGSDITGKKWASGVLDIGDIVGLEIADRRLVFAPGVELIVTIKLVPQEMGEPYEFKAIGVGKSGPTAGAVYDLVGWAQVSGDNDRRVVSAKGAIRAVRGPDAKPGTELGGMPVETVGSFVLAPQ